MTTEASPDRILEKMSLGEPSLAWYLSSYRRDGGIALN